jgi:hypothetical protein
MKHVLKVSAVISLMMLGSAWAHDEGHGPKVNDQPKQGGMVMPVIDKKEADKGASATMIYKAELVRKENGEAQLFVYDEKMNALPAEKLEKNAKAKIGPMKRNPKWKSEEFTLENKDGAYVGKLPKIKVKPYYIDITLTEGKRALLTAFENLD